MLVDIDSKTAVLAVVEIWNQEKLYFLVKALKEAAITTKSQLKCSSFYHVFLVKRVLFFKAFAIGETNNTNKLFG